MVADHYQEFNRWLRSPHLPHHGSRSNLCTKPCCSDTPWPGRARFPRCYPAQQQTIRLYPDHTDGEQELQPDKRQRISSIPEPASTQLLSSNKVYCVRPSQPPQLHVPDRREKLLHRNKMPPRQDRVIQATLAPWIELR